MTLPNFFVIGASRCGTTSLHHYLTQHPDVYMSPQKSPNFFVAHEPLPVWEGSSLRAMARQWIADLQAYEALFAGAGAKPAIGEVSPVYLQTRSAPRMIEEVCPEAKLIAILRHPVDRAYAHFLGRQRDGLERRSDFEAVVTDELSGPLPEEVAFGSYLGCGRYHHFLTGYFERFPREHIRVYLFEELQRDSAALLADLFEFLGVDATFVPNTARQHNRTGIIRNPILRFIWTQSVFVRTILRPYVPSAIRHAAGSSFAAKLVRPDLRPGLRSELVEVFRDDITRLATLIERDLSSWLT